MKKIMFTSLLAIISIGVNATNTDKLSAQYPHVVSFTNATITSSFYDDMMYKLAIEAIHQDSERVNATQNDTLQSDKDIDMACLADFEKTASYQQLQTQILTNLSSQDLKAFEQFLQTPTGQKWYLNLEKFTNAIKTDTFYDVYDMNDKRNPYSDLEQQQITEFTTRHGALFDAISKILHATQTKSLYQNYQKSCMNHGETL